MGIDGMLAVAADWVMAALLGALVATGEILGRYRDSPGRVARSGPAILYLLVNMLASVGVLALARAFNWTFGVTATASTAELRWTQVLVAGLGAMAVLRSSLFVMRIGDRDIGVGPSSFLQIILDAIDREVDRQRARARALLVGPLMNGVLFAKANQTLPAFCIALMQNLSADAQMDLASQVASLRAATDSDDRTRARLLGLTLLNVVGEDVLNAAVEATRAETSSIEPKAIQLMTYVSFEKAYMTLPTYCFALTRDLPDEEQVKFANQLDTLRDLDVNDRTKARLLGLLLLNLVGEEVLTAAVGSLGEEIMVVRPAATGGQPTPAGGAIGQPVPQPEPGQSS